MPNIRPVSDLRNHFTDITREAEASGEPVFLTKNGAGSIVVMSMDSWEQQRFESETYDRLKEAEIQALTTSKRLSHNEVISAARKLLQEAEA